MCLLGNWGILANNRKAISWDEGMRRFYVVKIYDPTARPTDVKLPVLNTESLQGCRVGLLDNGWPSWQTMLRSYEEKELTEAWGAATAKRWSIPVSSAAPSETLEEAARESDVVIVGLAN